MDLRIVTIIDCMEMYEYKDMSVVLHDGQVCGFIQKDETENEISLPDYKSEQG